MEIELSFEEMYNLFCEIWREYEKYKGYSDADYSNLSIVEKIMKAFCSDEKVARNMFQEFQKKFSNSKFKEVDWRCVNEFFESGKKDLNAAMVFYEMEDFANSIYHLQQSVEKLTKYWLMKYNAFTCSEVKSISHKTIMGYLNWIGKAIDVFISSLEKVEKETQSDNSKLLTELHNFKKQKEKARNQVTQISGKKELLRASAEEIMKAITAIDNIKTEFIKRFEEYRTSINEIEFLSFMLQELNTRITEDMFSDLLDYVGIIWEAKLNTLYLYILGAYTFPHETPARYYDSTLDFGPTNYSRELGIVKASPELFKRLGFVIKSYENAHTDAGKLLEMIVKEVPEDDGMGRV